MVSCRFSVHLMVLIPRYGRMAIKILIMIIFSSFKGTDLSRYMLASGCMPQRRDRGAMGRRRTPWLLQPLLKISYCELSHTKPTYSYVDKKEHSPQRFLKRRNEWST